MQQSADEGPEKESPAKSSQCLPVDVLTQHLSLDGVMSTVNDGHSCNGLMGLKPDEEDGRGHGSKSEARRYGEGSCYRASK